jgi:predicted Fe-Mo cluster-binding NifX family protein
MVNVPGSGAPEHAYLEMEQAMANKGYDMSAAEELIEKGMELHKKGGIPALRAPTGQLLDVTYNAPSISDHSYHTHEAGWLAMCWALCVACLLNGRNRLATCWKPTFQAKRNYPLKKSPKRQPLC